LKRISQQKTTEPHSVSVTQNGGFDTLFQILCSQLMLRKKTQLGEAIVFAWFHEKTVGGPVPFQEIIAYFARAKLARPNPSRLRAAISRSHEIHRSAADKDAFEVDRAVAIGLEEEYGTLIHNDEDIVSSSEVLDESLFVGKRQFLDKLIKQVNHCYSNNCFDACAMLMRRVFEIVLILGYERHGIQDQIKENGDYAKLERIVADAVQNKTLNVSRSRRQYDSIRNLGNFAAHKIHYNTRKSDIDEIKQDYRVCLEELYYIAGLKA